MPTSTLLIAFLSLSLLTTRINCISTLVPFKVTNARGNSQIKEYPPFKNGVNLLSRYRGGAEELAVPKGKKRKRIPSRKRKLGKYSDVNSSSKSIKRDSDSNERNIELEAGTDEPELLSFLDVIGLKESRYTRMVAQAWLKTPPISQFYIGASIGATLLAWLLNGNEWPRILELSWSKVVTKFQFWRPVTSFLYLGPFGLNYILTLHFMWTYMSDMEKLNAGRPEEFLVMLGFGATTLMAVYLILGVPSSYLGHNLATFLVYAWSRAHEGTSINMMDLFVIQAELIPWFFCLQAVVVDGELPIADVFGIVIGHLYQYLHRENLLLAPTTFLRSVMPKELLDRYKAIKSNEADPSV